MPYWEQANLDVLTSYRMANNARINASIKLNIGLRGFNVTFRGLPVRQHNDVVDYNEQFEWTWMQGKPGFGYDGRAQSSRKFNLNLVSIHVPFQSWEVAQTISCGSNERSSLSDSSNSGSVHHRL